MKELTHEAESGVDRFIHMTAEGYNLGDIRVVLELGSRDAEHAVALARVFPLAVVYAFECDSQGVERCAETLRIEDNHRIKLVGKAVSSTEGPIRFYPIDMARSPSKNPGASSLFRINPDYMVVEQLVQSEVMVESVRLDKFLEGEGITHVDAIWADLQGAELMALEGLGHLLDTVKIAVLEVAFKPVYLEQPLAATLDAFMEKHGLVRVGEVNANNWFGDAFYRSNRLFTV